MGRNKTNRRYEIILGARQFFGANNGFANVTVAELAGGLGISSATIYKHFGNYHTLVKEVISSCKTMAEVMEVIGPPQNSPSQLVYEYTAPEVEQETAST